MVTNCSFVGLFFVFVLKFFSLLFFFVVFRPLSIYFFKFKHG
jgi:hypothetical protein